MENGLFRKKSLERISSPEELHDYMRVTSPRLWMILAAIVVLLVGFIVYASTATMENTKQIRVKVETYHLSAEETGGEPLDGTYAYCELPLEELDVIKTGMKLRLQKETGRVVSISTYEEDNQINVVFEMDQTRYPMADGEYDGELVLESTTPISFLWN